MRDASDGDTAPGRGRHEPAARSGNMPPVPSSILRHPLPLCLVLTLAAAAATPRAQQAPPKPDETKTPAKGADADKKEPKWDVAAEFGPTSKVTFDTSEGTWMNVDVSP